jgi:hypothetical protein
MDTREEPSVGGAEACLADRCESSSAYRILEGTAVGTEQIFIG